MIIPTQHVVFYVNFVLIFLCSILVVVWSLSHVWLSWPHRLQPTRLLCPWDSPGKNTGVGCHFLLQYSILRGIKKMFDMVFTSSWNFYCLLKEAILSWKYWHTYVLSWGKNKLMKSNIKRMTKLTEHMPFFFPSSAPKCAVMLLNSRC